MEDTVFKVGQEIKCVEDFEIESPVTLTKIKVKQDDRAFIDSSGSIHYITGEARGKIEFANFKTKGYDHENIAEMLFQTLRRTFPIDDMLYDYDIEAKQIVNEMEYLLSDIL